jgi:type IV pilus assembly protein PilB
MKTRLGELLVQQGILKEEELQYFLEKQKTSKKRLGELLVEAKAVTKTDLVQILSSQLGIPYLDLETTVIEPEALALFPEAFARKYTCIPVSLHENTLTVAMADPLNLTALEDLRFSTNKEIQPALAVDTSILAAIDKHYHLERDLPQIMQDFSSDLAEEVQVVAQEGREEETENLADLQGVSQSAPIVRMVNLIINDAVTHRASDIHIEPQEKQVLVRYRIDGVLHETHRLPKWVHGAVVSRLKIMAALDISEKRLPQDGKIKINVASRFIDLRISTLPTHYGEKVVARILDQQQGVYTIEQLGFREEDAEKFKDFISRPQGIVLVTGPTGSGKSTTLYAAINRIKSPSLNIVTVEDPIEYEMEGINQVQVNTKTGLTFAFILRSILRQDPNVIMIGEIRDEETADIAIRAALTGHLVLSTIHTNDAPSAITRFFDLGVSPQLLVTTVTGIIAQRLVRRICPSCRGPYTPSEAEWALLEKTFPIDFPRDTLFYKGKGCPQCRQTGYRGRLGVYEVLSFTPRLKEQIMLKAPITKLRETAIAEGMTPLPLDMAIKLKAGLTTIEEVSNIIFYEKEEIGNICSRCGRALEEDFLACPYCGNRITELCQNCQKPLMPEWVICPYCCQPKASPKSTKAPGRISAAQ